MAHLHPFAAHSVAPAIVEDFVSLPIDSYSKEQMKKEINDKPQSFLGIIRPFSKEPFAAIRERFLQSTHLVKEATPTLYIYEIEDQHITYKGVISGIACSDLTLKALLPHEKTLEKREKTFEKYLREVQFNAEPVLLTHPDSKPISLLLETYSNKPPYYNFVFNNQRHRLWKIKSKDKMVSLSKAFKSIEKLYVADGHHRLASSFRLSQSTKVSEAQYCMCYIVPSSSLQLDSFYRIIDISKKITSDELMNRLSESFMIHPSKTYIKPKNAHTFGMYVAKKWYKLVLKKKSKLNAVALLRDMILHPLLNIYDLRNDPCISYGYSKSPNTIIEQTVNQRKGFLGITHFPINFENIRDSAEQGEMMPPKSSYIEPKIVSGMLLHSW